MPAHILLVEDDPFMRETLAELLTDEGYCVVTAAHGGHGLAALRQGTPFALVLLDLVMPEVSGLQFRQAQLQRDDWAQIPTMVLTADVCAAANMPILRGAMLAEKPLDLGSLLRAVQKACPKALSQRGRPSRRPPW